MPIARSWRARSRSRCAASKRPLRIRASAACSSRTAQPIGEGCHARAGEAHAEINALADAKAQRPGSARSDAYVTLEPCNHTGRTPPCTDALIAAGVARVVAAMADPNPHAAHGARRGCARPESRSSSGSREREARELNAGFISRMTRGRPWVRHESGGQSRWPHRAARRRESVDHRRGGARRRTSLSRPRMRGDDRHRHRAAGRSAAHRARHRSDAPAARSSSSTGMARRRRRPACSPAATRWS